MRIKIRAYILIDRIPRGLLRDIRILSFPRKRESKMDSGYSFYGEFRNDKLIHRCLRWGSSFLIVGLLLLACNSEKRQQVMAVLFDGTQETEQPKTVAIDTVRKRPDAQKSFSEDQEPLPTDIVKSIHPVFKPNQCTKCHDMNKANRLRQRQPALCYQCHPDFKNKYKKLHGPVAGGYCTACHLPHQSKYKYLLKHPARENCQYCHHAGDVAKNSAHEAISEIECMQCHNPHGGEDKFFLINQ